MNQSHFFAHLSRLKLINRWPLMRNVRTENVSEHSLQVASMPGVLHYWRCTMMLQKY